MKGGFYAEEISAFKESLPESNNLKQILDSGAKPFPEKMLMTMGWLGHDQVLDTSDFESNEGSWECYANGLDFNSVCSMSTKAWTNAYKRHCSTAETGYLYRRLMKLLEDVCIHPDGSVRLSDSRIIQKSYGDGFRCSQTQPVSLRIGAFDEEEKREFKDFAKSLSREDSQSWKDEVAQMKEMRKNIDLDTSEGNTARIRSPLCIKQVVLAHSNSIENGTGLSVRKKNTML